MLLTQNTSKDLHRPVLLQPTGRGRGQDLPGTEERNTDASGNASFTFKTRKKVGRGKNVTATTTDVLTNSISEFSGTKATR